ncbi:MAG: ArsR family transcriptional regulator [Candidatus Lokiarchaeota archaeon]|nr:ArsR family transcriptional regulator [Candidatus Lokiarchaeota archaeon]
MNPRRIGLNNEHRKLVVQSDQEVEAKNLKMEKEKVLQGKTLQIYWYLLTHNGAGVREIQKSLKISSPGTVSYQVDKLLNAGIISKSHIDGKYYVKEDIKKGVLGFYFHIGTFMIPRFSLYLVINILGFVGYIFFAGTHGDTFITNPGGILLLLFLIFSTSVNIYESIKLWERKPAKLV